MHVIQLASLLQAISLVSLGVVVMVRNHNALQNRYFLLLSCFTGLWVASSSLGGNVSNFALSFFFICIDFMFGLLSAWAFYGFCSIIRGVSISKLAYRLFVINFIVTTILITFNSSHFIEISKNDLSEESNIIVGILFYLLYALPVLVLAGLAFYKLFSKRSKEEISRPSSKLQAIRFSLLAATVFMVPSLSASTLIKDARYIESLQIMGNFGLMVFFAGSGYAIVKKQLFNIRPIFARSLAYFSSSVVLLIIVSGLITVLAGLFVSIDLYRTEILAVALSSVVFSPLIFTPLRKFFDKATNKIFYRDSYDTQAEIDKLSAIAVAEYEIDELATHSMQILSQSLKPTAGKLVLLDEHGEYYDDYKLHKSPRFGMLSMIEALKAQTESIIHVDEFEETQIDSNNMHSSKVKLYDHLRNHDIALSVRLSTKDEIVGYILFGPKLSGNLYSGQDLRFIGIAANEMAIAIQNARRFDEIQRFNQTLKLEIERATSELRTSNEKLQALDQAKDEFITMASHQLRTPLTSVKGYISMVMEGDAGKINPKQLELLTAAFTSSQRMVYLIADLLNVSRLHTGKFVIEPKEFSLKEMITSEIDQLKETARSRKIKIVFKTPKAFDNVYLDETKTRQVVMNFIDNAIYYTPAGGKIVVELTEDAKKVNFTVTDNGIGVPKQEQHNLFTKFYRAANARKARPDGTGLGLFMAKKVVADQGGSILFTSVEGQGSTFGFTFPKSRITPKKLPVKTDSKPASPVRTQ